MANTGETLSCNYVFNKQVLCIFICLVDPVLTAEFTWRLIFYKHNYERRISKNIEGKDFGGIECTMLKEKVTI
jgi:hypothetical protein